MRCVGSLGSDASSDAVRDLRATGCTVRQVPVWVLLRERIKVIVWPWGLLGLAMAASLLVRAAARGRLAQELWIDAVFLPVSWLVIWLWFRRRPKAKRLFVVGLTRQAREVLGLSGSERRGGDTIPQWPVWIDGGGVRITVDGVEVHLRERDVTLELGVTKNGSVATCVLMSPTASTPVPVRGHLHPDA